MNAVDTAFLDLAAAESRHSKDPNTKVGAVVVGENDQLIAVGYNGFPNGVKNTPERWQRPTKYAFVVHAEANAILRCWTPGKTIYLTHPPCQECTKLIIQAGIKRVVCSDGKASMMNPEATAICEAMLREAGVALDRA